MSAQPQVLSTRSDAEHAREGARGQGGGAPRRAPDGAGRGTRARTAGESGSPRDPGAAPARRGPGAAPAPRDPLAPRDPGGATIRVLLLDHREFARAGLRTVLEDQPDISVVGETGDRRTALRLWRELAPDVVVAGDRTAERELATALAQDAAARPPRLITLVDCAADIPAAATAAWTASFLPQHASSGELTSAVRMVSAGYRLIAPGQALAAHSRPRAAEHPPTARPATVPPPREAPAPAGTAPPPGNLSGNLSSLTPRERDVLELLTLGMSNAEISAKLMIGQSTVKSHVRSMLAKLGLRNRAEAIIYSYENARTAS